MSKMMVDVKVGEALFVGDTSIKLNKKSGQVARLEITTSPDIEIRVPKTSARMSVLQTTGVHSHGEHTI